jgi:hypothetical protein
MSEVHKAKRNEDIKQSPVEESVKNMEHSFYSSIKSIDIQELTANNNNKDPNHPL